MTRIRGDVWPGPELRFIVAVGLSDVRWVTLSQKLQESEFFTKLLLFGAEVDCLGSVAEPYFVVAEDEVSTQDVSWLLRGGKTDAARKTPYVSPIAYPFAGSLLVQGFHRKG